jgi:hypothetical protein
MRMLLIILAILVLVGPPALVRAQAPHFDPPSLSIMSAEKPITVDGKLDETDWQRRIFHLNYRAGYKPDDGSYGITGSVLVTAGIPGQSTSYTDTTSSRVYFLHYGTDLYIALLSTDASVCARWGAWEGDGLFMKVKNKAGSDIEYKLMFNDPVDTLNALMAAGGNAPAGSYAGATYLFPGTIPSNNSAPDSGYSLEMVIHLDMLGYTASDAVLLDCTVMEPDFYTRTVDEGTAPGTVQFYKSWWGSEWGGGDSTSYRKLILADKPVADAYATNTPITLDGKLDEAEWFNAPSIDLGPASKDGTNWWFMQWADTLASYDDRTTTTVKMLHHGTDLYLGFSSNDSSVCNWSSGWEGDGPFIWMSDKFTVPSPGNRQEIHLMYTGDSIGGPAQFSVNANVPTGGVEGQSFEPVGTVTRTETNGKDHGYTGEVIIHGDKWGYVDGDTVRIGIVIWDMDRGSADVTDTHQRIYAKAWWGSEWADNTFDRYFMYRGIYLSPQLATGASEPKGELPKTYALMQNYPNPFNPETQIRYQIPQSQRVTLKVYNLLGEEVATLVDGIQNAGEHMVRWNGRSASGTAVASGVYFCRMQAGSFSDVRKLALLK